jgi:inosine/xanthosine triphosphate pyrophosphatase family protein
VFLLPGGEATMAEIPAKKKNEISHRAKAFRALKASLTGK